MHECFSGQTLLSTFGMARIYLGLAFSPTRCLLFSFTKLKIAHTYSHCATTRTEIDQIKGGFVMHFFKSYSYINCPFQAKRNTNYIV